MFTWLKAEYNKTTLDIISGFHKMVMDLEAHVDALEDLIGVKQDKVGQLTTEIANHNSDWEYANSVLDNMSNMIKPVGKPIPTPDT